MQYFVDFQFLKNWKFDHSNYYIMDFYVGREAESVILKILWEGKITLLT